MNLEDESCSFELHLNQWEKSESIMEKTTTIRNKNVFLVDLILWESWGAAKKSYLT